MKKVKVFIEFPGGISTGEVKEEITFTEEEFEEIDPEEIADDIFHTYCHVNYMIEDVEE